MTVCPIALASGCKQCFAFSYCPVKSILGDYATEVATTNEQIVKGEDEQPGDE
jgi:hypothetical protein